MSASSNRIRPAIEWAEAHGWKVRRGKQLEFYKKHRPIVYGSYTPSCPHAYKHMIRDMVKYDSLDTQQNTPHNGE